MFSFHTADPSSLLDINNSLETVLIECDKLV